MIRQIEATIGKSMLGIAYQEPKRFEIFITNEDGVRQSVSVDREVIEWLKDSYNILYTTMLIEEGSEDKP